MANCRIFFLHIAISANRAGIRQFTFFCAGGGHIAFHIVALMVDRNLFRGSCIAVDAFTQHFARGARRGNLGGCPFPLMSRGPTKACREAITAVAAGENRFSAFKACGVNNGLIIDKFIAGRVIMISLQAIYAIRFRRNGQPCFFSVGTPRVAMLLGIINSGRMFCKAKNHRGFFSSVLAYSLGFSAHEIYIHALAIFPS